MDLVNLQNQISDVVSNIYLLINEFIIVKFIDESMSLSNRGNSTFSILFQPIKILTILFFFLSVKPKTLKNMNG